MSLSITSPAEAAPPAANRPKVGDAVRQGREAVRRMLAHKLRCRDLPRPSSDEVARMVAEYRARGGRVVQVAAAHAGTIQNGAGRDADRWTT